ncbi:MAG: hypothetical protein US48_C0013G0002 [Candidatus Levybacteria bacterium GW2011_GWA2_37_36]|nr:MAG: hypothetical protein US48_C0013G0002 [Candidatus Levybacteria bacterium GW2011_GWA2_37_36]
MKRYEPNQEIDESILSKERDLKYNAYTDLRLVANLSDVGEMDIYPPSIIERAEAIRNLRGKGFDLGLAGLRLTQKMEEGKEILNVVVDSSKSSEYLKFVDEMKEVRKWFLGETTIKPETPVLNKLGIDTTKFVETKTTGNEPLIPAQEMMLNGQITDTDDTSGVSLGGDSLKKLDDEKMNFEVVSKAEIEKKNMSEYQNPASKLILLGDITRKSNGEFAVSDRREEGEISNEMRASMIRKLVASGFDVSVIGIKVKENSASLEYYTNFRDIDDVVLIKLIKEIEEQDKNYDEGKFSDEFKKFMGSNLDRFKMTKDLLFRDRVFRGENQTKKGKDGEKTEKKDSVWYDGILEDLKIASFLDHHLSKDEVSRSDEVMERLRKKFPKLPKLSQNEGTQEDLNRRKLRAVYEYLKDGEISHFAKDFFKTKEEAEKFLEAMRVDNGEGDEKKGANSPEKAEVVLSEENPIIQELKMTLKTLDQKTKWEAKMAEIRALPQKEQENKFWMLIALARMQRNKRFLDRDIDPDGKIAKFWDDHKGRLGDLGVKVV